MRIRLFALLSLLIAGCAWQSEALQLGNGLYQTSANASPARGGLTGAQEMALKNADAKCRSLGKRIEVTDIRTELAPPMNGVATVTFRCL